VPIPSVLRGYLVEHRKRRFALGQRSGFVFGESTETPFNYDVTYDCAPRVWKAAGLKPVSLHQCRHTYVTLMHEAGFSLEEIGDYVGHNSAFMTDRYRHLREGHEARGGGAVRRVLDACHEQQPLSLDSGRKIALERYVRRQRHSTYCRPVGRAHQEGR